jgi:hypothetical protein
MTTLSYNDQTPAYREADRREATRSHGLSPGLIFLWIAWLLAAAFWAFTSTTAIGIMEAVMRPSNGPSPGEVDAGGVGWGLMNFVGPAILGLVLAYGLFRYATRDRRKDAATEASTAALYDTIERQGGEDLTTRSPEAREPEERDAYRAAEGDLR